MAAVGVREDAVTIEARRRPAHPGTAGGSATTTMKKPVSASPMWAALFLLLLPSRSPTSISVTTRVFQYEWTIEMVIAPPVRPGAGSHTPATPGGAVEGTKWCRTGAGAAARRVAPCVGHRCTLATCMPPPHSQCGDLMPIVSTVAAASACAPQACAVVAHLTKEPVPRPSGCTVLHGPMRRIPLVTWP